MTHELEAAAAFPWPPPDDHSIPSAFVRTWQAATFQPASFFRAMPGNGSTGAALLYYFALGILIAGAELFWRTIRPPSGEHASLLEGLGTGGALSPILTFLLSPLLLIASLALSAGVSHLLLKLFGGAHRDVAFTARVFAFAYSPMIFAVVPVIGTIAGFVWMVIIAIIGLREGHGTTTGRAAAAILVPVALGLFLLAIAVLIVAAGALLEIPV